jgi:hypothetical protein
LAATFFSGAFFATTLRAGRDDLMAGLFFTGMAAL